MTIDWEKIKARPDKVQKIKGGLLLELKERIDLLESELSNKDSEIIKLNEKIKELSRKLAGREKSLTRMTEKYNRIKKNFDEISEGKLN